MYINCKPLLLLLNQPVESAAKRPVTLARPESQRTPWHHPLGSPSTCCRSGRRKKEVTSHLHCQSLYRHVASSGKQAAPTSTAHARPRGSSGGCWRAPPSCRFVPPLPLRPSPQVWVAARHVQVLRLLASRHQRRDVGGGDKGGAERHQISGALLDVLLRRLNREAWQQQ